jgi:antitoxin MazE
MTATIQKWGNSLALRLPSAVAEQIHVREGAAVKLEVEDGTLRIKSSRPQYRLGELLRQVKPSNLHAETDWGAPKGREIW